MNFFRLNWASKKARLATIAFFGASLSFAQISFAPLNLNEHDEMLFSLETKNSYSVESPTVFKTKIQNGAAEYFPNALTCIPEQITAFAGGQKLQIRNRYGTAFYDFSSQSLKWIERAGTFADNFSPPLPSSISETGRWLCSLERTDLFKARLVVTEIDTGKKIVLDDDCSLSYLRVGVKWSPDGKNFVYEKNGSLYFCEPENLFKGRSVQEQFRKICDGNINCINWNDDENLVYISSDLIFQVGIKDLVTFGLYSQFIPLGKIIGRLPQKFNGGDDKFWVSDDALDFFIVHRDESISWYKKNLGEEGGAFVRQIFSSPFFERGMNVISFEAFWAKCDEVVLCARLSQSGNGKENSLVYSISVDGKMTRRIFAQDTNFNAVASPDKNFIAFASAENVCVFDIETWKIVGELENENALSLAWRDDKTLCVGGENCVKEFSVLDSSQKNLFPSGANFAWWIGENQIAFKNQNGNAFLLDEENSTWTDLTGSEITQTPPCLQNSNYRIFAGTTKNSFYENALYVRTLSGKITTKALLSKNVLHSEPRQKVALVFDADENADGLNAVLALCNEYNLKCTFFFNGEFIRRYPAETKRIAQTGHECDAIFFNNIDLLDKIVYNDKTFIAKGLARLEDEFFACTGKELSLYWHAPGGKADEKICEEGAAAGYTYVDLTSPNIIQIASIGNVSNSALYEKFHLLINELVATGAEIVTISDLDF